jgi:hypothetical protein
MEVGGVVEQSQTALPSETLGEVISTRRDYSVAGVVGRTCFAQSLALDRHNRTRMARGRTSAGLQWNARGARIEAEGVSMAKRSRTVLVEPANPTRLKIAAGGRRSLGLVCLRAVQSQRKVRTPPGNTPRRIRGDAGRKPRVTESVTENKPPC